MAKELVSLKDLKSGKFLDPQLVESTEQFLRSLEAMLNSPQELGKDGLDPITVRQFPSDFQVWILGTFTNESGILTIENSLVCDCISLVHAK